MSFGMLVYISLQALRRNLSRSALTMLGIIIGVFAVIASMTIGAGARAAVLKQIDSLGANRITITPAIASASLALRVMRDPVPSRTPPLVTLPAADGGRRARTRHSFAASYRGTNNRRGRGRDRDRHGNRCHPPSFDAWEMTNRDLWILDFARPFVRRNRRSGLWVLPGATRGGTRSNRSAST
jgi:hypothetical protein